jgi:6-phosphogluconolactonase
VTPNGRHAYVTNTGSGTVSLYRIGRDGRVALAQSVAAGTAGTGPIDAYVSENGRKLFVLNGRVQQIAAYRIAGDGSLTAAGGASGLPAGSVGLAAN